MKTEDKIIIKKGVSIISLIVSIVVIIILVTAILLNIANTGIIKNVQEARFKSDMTSIIHAIELENLSVIIENTDPDYEGIIPDKYKNQFEIDEYGKLLYTGEDEDKIAWVKSLGIVIKWEQVAIPQDWINISRGGPINGISLLVSDSITSEGKVAFICTTSQGTYTVDWGDGYSNTYQSGQTASHNYVVGTGKPCTEGYTTFRINISPDTGDLTRYYVQKPEDVNVNTYTYPILWCEVKCDTLNNCTYMFRDSNYANKAELRMFGTARKDSLKNVTNMSFMFFTCSSLTNLSLFDTSNVINIASMLRGCSSLTNIPVFDTRKVTSMSGLFYECTSLTTAPLLDTSNVTVMSSMFYNCKALETVPMYNTNKLKNADRMFMGCSELTNIPELNTSSVESTDSMFYACTKLQSIPQLNTSNVITMNAMFRGCSSIITIPKLDTSKVTNMDRMFMGCTLLDNIPSIDTGKANNMYSMFSGCTSLTTIPALNISSSANITDIFFNCNLLTNINVSNTGLTDVQLNDLFNQLTDRSSKTSGQINITGNIGEFLCNKETATSKNWTVIP